MRSFYVFFDLRLNKRLSEQSGAGDLSRYRAHYNVTVMVAGANAADGDDWINGRYSASYKVTVSYIDGLVRDCRISIANALEILQSCTKPSIFISISLNILRLNKKRY